MSNHPSGLEFVYDENVIPAVPAADVHRAALTVCHHATDLDDARLLLDALGIRNGRRLSVVRIVQPPADPKYLGLKGGLK